MLPLTYALRNLMRRPGRCAQLVLGSSVVVLLLMLFAAHIIETGTVNQSEVSKEALALIIFVIVLLLAVLVVAGGLYQYRIEQQRVRAQVRRVAAGFA